MVVLRGCKFSRKINRQETCAYESKMNKTFVKLFDSDFKANLRTNSSNYSKQANWIVAF